MTQLQPSRLEGQKQLHPTRFGLDEHAVNTWRIRPEHDTPFEAVMNSAYWAHVSAKLRSGDIIHVVAEDLSYWAELLVLDAGKLYAKVFELRKIDIKPQQLFNVEIPKGYEIKWRGPKRQWSVLRGVDVLVDGKSKPEAEQWLTDHIKAA